MRGRWTTGDEGAQYDAPFDEWRTHLEGTRSSTILDFALRDVTAFLLRFRDRHTPGQVKVANAMLTSTYGMAFNINPLQPHERLEDQIAVYYRHDSRQSVSHKEKPRQGFDMSDLVEEMLATGPSRTVADDILIMHRRTLRFGSTTPRRRVAAGALSLTGTASNSNLYRPNA